jgi:hypothetical protein
MATAVTNSSAEVESVDFDLLVAQQRAGDGSQTKDVMRVMRYLSRPSSFPVAKRPPTRAGMATLVATTTVRFATSSVALSKTP